MRRLLAFSLLASSLTFVATPALAATCSPSETTVGSQKVLTFTSVGNCDWQSPVGVTSLRVLVVGGGGAGGGGKHGVYYGNGGGGGEVKDSTVSITSGAILAVTVGAGGVGTTHNEDSTSVNNGQSSSFGSMTANGGTSTADRNSRTGGTSGSLKIGGTGVNTVVEGGGGGGAGANGSSRNGGAGVSSDITGLATQYGGGGASMGNNGGQPQYGTASGGG